MRIIFIVFMSNLRRALSTKKKFIINIFVPIAAIMLSMIVSYVSSSSINIGIVKVQDSMEVNRLISLLQRTEGIKVNVIDRQFEKTDTILGKYDGIITFNKGFNENETRELDDYFSFYNVKDPKINDMMRNLIKTYLISDEPINLKTSLTELQGGKLSKDESIIAFLATVLLISTVVNAAVMIKDRDENTFYRFLFSPNGGWKYVLGNVLYNYVFSYVQLFIAIAAAFIFGMKLGISFTTLLAYGLLLTLLMTAFGTLIACLFKKELYANLFAAAISLVLSLIGGTFIVFDKMPKGLQILSNVTPNRWIIKATQYLEHGTVNNINPMLVLAAFSIIFCAAAAVINSSRKVAFK